MYSAHNVQRSIPEFLRTMMVSASAMFHISTSHPHTLLLGNLLSGLPVALTPCVNYCKFMYYGVVFIQFFHFDAIEHRKLLSTSVVGERPLPVSLSGISFYQTHRTLLSTSGVYVVTVNRVPFSSSTPRTVNLCQQAVRWVGKPS